MAKVLEAYQSRDEREPDPPLGPDRTELLELIGIDAAQSRQACGRGCGRSVERARRLRQPPGGTAEAVAEECRSER